MDSSLLSATHSPSTATEWHPPSKEIQSLFNFEKHEVPSKECVFSEEEYAKLPSTLMKAIRRTEILMERSENAKRHAIESNNEIKAIQTLIIRHAKRCLKDIHKSEMSQAKTETKRGFNRPCHISKAMCDFMGVEEGVVSSRMEVNQFINEYVKRNNLVDVENGQHIVPDAKLWEILSETAKGNSITYFSIQKYIKHHFIKI
jgi:chromatin remodeling complex protein RSC6